MKEKNGKVIFDSFFYQKLKNTHKNEMCEERHLMYCYTSILNDDEKKRFIMEDINDIRQMIKHDLLSIHSVNLISFLIKTVGFA